MAATAAAADPPGYFVGRPLHYQDQQPQAEPPQPTPAVAEAAVDDPNAVNAQVPGYYKGRVQPRPSDGTEYNNKNNNADAAVQPNREPGFLAKLLSCFSGSRENAN